MSYHANLDQSRAGNVGSDSDVADFRAWIDTLPPDQYPELHALRYDGQSDNLAGLTREFAAASDNLPPGNGADRTATRLGGILASRGNASSLAIAHDIEAWADDDILRIDRERHRKEDELLLLLLACTWNTRSHAVYAARLGHDPAQAARTVILGDNGGYFLGLVPLIVQAQADAWDAGYRRGAKLTGDAPGTPNPVIREAAMQQYRQEAGEYASDLADTIGNRIRDIWREADSPTGEPMTPKEQLAGIRRVFDDEQASRKHPGHFQAEGEVAICGSYNDGMMTWFVGNKQVLGLRHVSILDDVTTKICIERDGLRLPVSDPFWKRNTPPLHFRCRSLLLPILKPFTPSTRLPDTQPMPGFGIAPIGIFLT